MYLTFPTSFPQKKNLKKELLMAFYISTTPDINRGRKLAKEKKCCLHGFRKCLQKEKLYSGSGAGAILNEHPDLV